MLRRWRDGGSDRGMRVSVVVTVASHRRLTGWRPAAGSRRGAVAAAGVWRAGYDAFMYTLVGVWCF